jgi:hypothetical protein
MALLALGGAAAGKIAGGSVPAAAPSHAFDPKQVADVRNTFDERLLDLFKGRDSQTLGRHRELIGRLVGAQAGASRQVFGDRSTSLSSTSAGSRFDRVENAAEASALNSLVASQSVRAEDTSQKFLDFQSKAHLRESGTNIQQKLTERGQNLQLISELVGAAAKFKLPEAQDLDSLIDEVVGTEVAPPTLPTGSTANKTTVF